MAIRRAGTRGVGGPNAGRTLLIDGASRASFSSQALFGLSDWIYSIALVLLAYRLSGELAVAAFVLLVQAIGRLAGADLANRVTIERAGTVLAGTGVLRAVLVASLIAVTSRDDLWLAVVVAALIGLSGPAAEVARRIAVPVAVAVDPARYLRSRLLGRWDQVAMIAGAISSGLLIGVWSERAAFAVAASIGLAATALASRAPAPRSAQPSAADPTDERAWSTLKRVRRYRNLILALACAAALGIATRVVLVDVVVGEHEGDEFIYGLFVALAGVGAFAGPVSAPRLLSKLPSEVVMAGVVGAVSAALIALHLIEPLALLIPVVFGCGLLAITGERVAETVTRRIIPDRNLDGALRLLAGAAITGQVIALAAVAALDRVSGLTVVVLGLVAGSILFTGISILDYAVGRVRRFTTRDRYEQTLQPEAVQD